MPRAALSGKAIGQSEAAPSKFKKAGRMARLFGGGGGGKKQPEQPEQAAAPPPTTLPELTPQQAKALVRGGPAEGWERKSRLLEALTEVRRVLLWCCSCCCSC